MAKVKVFQLNEWDGVAAESLEQAKDWYLKTTGLNEEDAFDDYEANELPLTFEMWEDETRSKKQTLQSEIEKSWEGKPFLIFSSEW